MYCSTCGSRIADGSVYCPVCSSPVYQAAQPRMDAQLAVYPQQPQNWTPYSGQQGYGMNPQQERYASMQEMNRMLNYFSLKAAQYNEYDEINYILDKYDKRRRGLLVWGIILMVAGVVWVGVAALARYSYDQQLIAAFRIWCIVWFLGASMMIVGYNLSARARRKNKELALQRLAQLADELHAHFLNFGYCEVGEEYTNPSILQEINEKLRAGRAYNIRDAINLMFSDAHMTQMEYAALETMRSSRQAAAGATTAAVFAAANFFLR